MAVILVADDEKDFREVIVAVLESKGFTVRQVTNGVEAVEACKKNPPDVVLMDVQMPEKDGIQAVIDLHEDPKTKDIKIIFLTNLGDSWPSASDINGRFARQIGALDYFKKSGDYNILVDKIRAALEKTATQR